MTTSQDQQSSALERLRQITRGIDEQQTHDDDGWWETSVGAEFGRKKLAELEILVGELTAMPGGLEPVAGQCRFTGEAAWRECPAEHVSLVLSTPNEWEGYEVRYLYADPRSQDRRPPVSLTAPQLQKLGRWLAAPSDLDGDQPVPRE